MQWTVNRLTPTIWRPKSHSSTHIKIGPFILELRKVVFLLKGMGMWNLLFFLERSRGFEKSFIRATIFVVYQLVNKPLIFRKRGGGGEFEQLAMQKAGRLLTPPSLRQLELCSPNWPGSHSVDQILQKKSECGDAQLQSPHWWGGGRADWSSRPVYPSRAPGNRQREATM